jgi:hypothetical protein
VLARNVTREEKNARHNDYMKRYRASDKAPRYRERMRNYMRDYRLKNNEKVREQERVRYHRDPSASRAKLSSKRLKVRQRLGDIKLASGCVDCGFKLHPAALHFDHLPQYEKKLNIGLALTNARWSDILAEINKCVVRCANCHAIKTAERRKGMLHA